MKYIKKENWILLRDAIKHYIAENLKGETEPELYASLKKIFIGLFGKKSHGNGIVYPDKTFILREWIRGSQRDFVAEYLIVWKYLRIEGTPMILERRNSRYRLDPLSTKHSSIPRYLKLD